MWLVASQMEAELAALKLAAQQAPAPAPAAPQQAPAPTSVAAALAAGGAMPETELALVALRAELQQEALATAELLGKVRPLSPPVTYGTHVMRCDVM